ncbi:MAG TPA: TIM-barrel domain-containing protein, partial [Armatimonadota bacterium]|nr:TIM-barrel domain-containing protein [Armatimonadota bacterium]
MLNIHFRHGEQLLLLCWMLCLGIITLFAQPSAGAASQDIVLGKVRVQLLSPTLVRVEQAGALGFEDRDTFLVVQRDWPRVASTQRKETGGTRITTNWYTVWVPEPCNTLAGIEIRKTDGTLLYKIGDVLPPARPHFPAPGMVGTAFALTDAPRIVPPAWGATPPPTSMLDKLGALAATGGWDLRNNAPDVYVLLPTNGYAALRKEYLRLTGPIPLPPQYILGFWHSRWHPYSDKEALADIAHYRNDDFPLDVFVVDTDWRVGGSGGYDVNTTLFPDMAKFITDAHQQHVKVMFNDHPQPNGMAPLATSHFQYRWMGLTSQLHNGLDIWWFDRNWPSIIPGPVDGIATEEWGQRIYTDTAAKYRPHEHPVIMSMPSSHPASHRFPIWWTGDIQSSWLTLRNGVQDSVNGGVEFTPWVGQDLGGFLGRPSDELYIRFLEWGCLSPVTRLHCSYDQVRYPWAYGHNAEAIVRDYV